MSSPPSEAWWTAQQVALVEDRTRLWRPSHFTPSDAVSFSQDGQTVLERQDAALPDVEDARVVAGGWDHEHCALCWATILPHPGDQPSGYSDGRDWLCSQCYESFIAPRL